MPLAQISISRSTSTKVLHAISDVVYDAMTNVANLPKHDKFQIVSRHVADELIYPPDGFLGMTNTANIVFIEITWNSGRTTEIKKAFVGLSLTISAQEPAFEKKTS